MSPSHRRWLFVAVLVAALAAGPAGTAAASDGSATAGPSEPAVGPAAAVSNHTDGNGTNDAGDNGTATPTGAPPSVSLGLDGEPVAAGSYSLTASDPTLAVDASIETAGAELETVGFRVNSRVVRTYAVDGAEASVSLALPLSTGNNSVRVVVEDSGGRLAQRDLTVGKDDLAPWIGLSRPEPTEPRRRIPNLTVNRSLVTFGVETAEFTGVREAFLEVSGEDGRDAAFRTDPGDRFEQTLLVGLGNTTATIRVTDELGNVRTRRFRVELNDSQAPTVSLDPYPARTTERTVTLTGTLADNVWVRNATVAVDHLDATNRTGVTNYAESVGRDAAYEYSRAGRRVAFEKQVLLRPGRNRIEIRARDHRGQTGNRTLVVERTERARTDENGPPRVTIDANRTRRLPDGRVRVVAGVADEDLNLARVTAETADLDTGTIVDIERDTDPDDPGSTTLNVTLQGAEGTTVVRVRASDAENARDTAVRQLGAGTTPRSEPAATATTTATATSTPAGPAPATATRRANQRQATAGNETADGLPVVGSFGGAGGILGSAVGALTGIAPFTVGSFVFVLVTYAVVRGILARRRQAT